MNGGQRGNEHLVIGPAERQTDRRTGIFEDHLFLGPLKDVFLDSVLCYQAIHVDVILLSDPMCARHGLQVLRVPSISVGGASGRGRGKEKTHILRIPIAVENDDGIGWFQQPLSVGWS
jgi:hypothetical protein